MFKKNKFSLRSQAWQHKVAPRESAWLKLDAKLEKSRSQSSIKYYRNISIAAVIVAVIGVMAAFFTHASTTMEFNSSYHTSDLYSDQVTTNKESNIYDIHKLRNLKMAYQKLQGSDNDI